MRKMLYNITSGNPKILIKSVAASFLDGLMKIIPAILVYDVIYTIYQGMERGSVLDTDRLWKVCFGLFFMMVIQYVTAGLSYEQTFNAAYKTAAEGRIALAEHLRKLSLGFLSSKDPGDITTMMLSDYATVEQAISHYVPQLVSAAIFPVITFILLSFVNIKMALAMFLCLPVGVLIMALSSNIQKQLGQKHVKAKVESASRLQEYLQGIKEIKAHNLSGEKFQRLKIAFESLMKASIRLEGLIGPFVMVSILIIRSGLTFMIFVGAYELVGGSIDLPVFLGFLLLGTRVFEPITVVLTNFAELKYAVLSGERIMEITKESPLKGNLEVPKSSHISFENVSFGYEDARVLKGVSFEIPQKKMTALVGLSGSGKSTITKLIARFWDVDGGKISLGGEDIRNIKPEELLSQISMVFQDVYLFKDTVKNNIRVGKADATMKEIEEAAKLACCHEFIERLPLGYDTPIGEGGCTLSGGEKQRISIARALLKNAPIVLLDEATASLDPENEVHVQRALNQLVKEKTVVTIAHRLKTIQGADQIVVLDKGEIQAIGTHEELARGKGLYGTLWKLQQESSGWHIGA